MLRRALRHAQKGVNNMPNRMRMTESQKGEMRKSLRPQFLMFPEPPQPSKKLRRPSREFQTIRQAWRFAPCDREWAGRSKPRARPIGVLNPKASEVLVRDRLCP